MEKAEFLSPYGRVGLCVRDDRLAGVTLSPPGSLSPRPAEGAMFGPAAGDGAVSAAMAGFVDALRRYFAGEDVRLDGASFDLSGAGDFARRVYRELLGVPFGETVTYGELAARVGSPHGARAVGQAVGRNPVPILVPCHRVVASGGGLGGFSGGLDWKRSLLAHEGREAREKAR